MVMGAWRLSQARVLTRRAAAIEMLGSATVLCTDKTGTLTENRMTIAELRTPTETWQPATGAAGGSLIELIQAAYSNEAGRVSRSYVGHTFQLDRGHRSNLIAAR